METMDELKKRLNSSSQYLQSNDMQVVEVKEGYAKVEMIIDEQILNVHGFVHGGALYSLADTAAGAASFTSGRDSVTLSGTINYIKPGRGGKLIGIAQKISAGRTTGVYEVLFSMTKMFCCHGQPLRCSFSIRNDIAREAGNKRNICWRYPAFCIGGAYAYRNDSDTAAG